MLWLGEGIAYTIRIILSHFRLKFDGFQSAAQSSDPAVLIDIYTLVVPATQTLQPRHRRKRGVMSLEPMNPFIAFRLSKTTNLL